MCSNTFLQLEYGLIQQQLSLPLLHLPRYLLQLSSIWRQYFRPTWESWHLPLLSNNCEQPYAFCWSSDLLHTLPSWTVYHQYQNTVWVCWVEENQKCRPQMKAIQWMTYYYFRKSEFHTINYNCLWGAPRNLEDCPSGGCVFLKCHGLPP